jgi:Family of unknown function (DUF5947)
MGRSSNTEQPITEVGRSPDPENAFDALRRFARKRRPVERCELCSLELSRDHPHLIELAARKLVCSCDACAVLFDGRTGGKYKRVPRRIQSFANFCLTDGQWEGLMIPINMAFFFTSSIDHRVNAFYPSPAGAVESLLSLETWQDILRENPALGRMEPDVEALLVNRVGQARAAVAAEYYIVPIDECYKLVGLIRSHWRGLSGGTEVWQEIGRFFGELKERAVNVSEETHA